MADLEKIAEDLSSLTVIEAAELSTMLEEKWGVSAAAPVAVAGAAAPAAAEEAEEQVEFTVMLTAFGEKKNVAVRTPTAVAAIRGTVFKAKAGDDESSVQVYDGNVDVNQVEKFMEERRKRRKDMSPKGPDGAPKFKLGPVKEIAAPTQVSGPYEITLEEWVTLAKGMQINVRADGKYHMFEFDQEKEDKDDFVKWNKELDTDN